MRQCPFPGCHQVIAPDKFACRHHWYALNHEQRLRIWASWNAYRNGDLDTDGLREQQDRVIQEFIES